MATDQISKLLDELHDKDVYIRSSAIKKVLKGKINDEKIVIALKEIADKDNSIAVKDLARSALDKFDVEYSKEDKPIAPKTNWLYIGLLTGLFPCLIFLGLGLEYVFIFGPGGVLGGLLGAYIGNKGGRATTVIGGFIGALIASFIWIEFVFGGGLY